MARNKNRNTSLDENSDQWVAVIRNNDLAEAERLLALPAGPNATVPTSFGPHTILERAIAIGARAISLLIIAKGPDPEQLYSPLCLAIRTGQADIFKALLKAGAPVVYREDVADRSKPYTSFAGISCVGFGPEALVLLEPLIALAQQQGEDVPAMLLEVGKRALHEVDREALLEAVRLGADLTSPDLLGETIHFGTGKKLAILLEVTSFTRETLAKAASEAMWNEFHALEIMEVLIRHQVYPESYADDALIMGCMQEYARPDVEAFEFLLKNGASANARGGKPLKTVVGQYSADWELVALLLRYGADPAVLSPEEQKLLKAELGLP